MSHTRYHPISLVTMPWYLAITAQKHNWNGSIWTIIDIREIWPVTVTKYGKNSFCRHKGFSVIVQFNSATANCITANTYHLVTCSDSYLSQNSVWETLHSWQKSNFLSHTNMFIYIAEIDKHWLDCLITYYCSQQVNFLDLSKLISFSVVPCYLYVLRHISLVLLSLCP